MISIRKEQPGDSEAIRDLTTHAFGGHVEADIIDALRYACPDVLSIVAVDNGSIVGHILFSPVTVETANGTITGMGLAPMAVLPDWQRQGIGSALVRHAFTLLRNQHCPFVIVLGHPDYYSRFGFVPTSRYGLTCQWEGVPDEAFMVIVFDKDIMENIHGVARYRDEFNQAM